MGAAKLPMKLLEFLNRIGMRVAVCEIFHTPPKAKLRVHLDSGELNNFAKLNFCYGAAGSLMIWYRLNDPSLIKSSTNICGFSYGQINEADVRPKHAQSIGTPTLVNVGQPHAVFNSTNEERWVISLVLRDTKSGLGIPFDEAKARLGTWVV
jgi:hypothetical protein